MGRRVSIYTNLRKTVLLPDQPTGSAASWKTPEVLVPFLGLLYSGLYLIYVAAPSLATVGFSGFVAILLPFAIIFLALSFAVWKQNRFGFLGAVLLTGLFIFLEGSFALDEFGNPSNYSMFFGVVTVLPTLIMSFLYSILGLRMFWKKGMTMGAGRMIPRSSVLALIFVGFMLGGLVIGVFAGATQARLLNAPGTEDIKIVQGAANEGNAAGYYSPANFAGDRRGHSHVGQQGRSVTHRHEQYRWSLRLRQHGLRGFVLPYILAGRNLQLRLHLPSLDEGERNGLSLRLWAFT